MELGYASAERLVPLTFLVIVGTVATYGIFTPIVARRLAVATPNPQGLLMIGAAPWVRALAKTLVDQGIRVVLADSNWANVAAARRQGLQTHYMDVLTERALEDLDLSGIGRLLALTPNDEVNALAALHFSDAFDRARLFQLPPEGSEADGQRSWIPKHLRGRFLFRSDATHDYLAARFQGGAVIKKTRLTEEFDFAAFRSRYGESAIPLLGIRDSGEVLIFTAINPPAAKPGQTLISLADPMD